MNEMNLCRLCFTKQNKLYSLLENGGVQIVEILTSIQIKEDDNLPKNACRNCWDNVKLVTNIRQNILEADKKFKLCFNKDLIESIKVEVESLDVTRQNYCKGLNQTDTSVTGEDTERGSDDENTSNIGVCEEETDSFDCPICGVVRETYNTYTDHIKEHFGSKQKCDFCGENKFENINSYQNHIQIQHKGIHFKRTCNECFISFLYKPFYDLHKAKVHPHVVKKKLRNTGTKKECPICHKVIATNYISTHIKLHNEDPRKCILCGVTYKNSRSFRVHFLRHHPHEEVTNYYEPNIKVETLKKDKFECADCDKIFTKRRDYQMHVYRHKTKTCPECNKEISRQNFTLHMSIHTDASKKCSLCEITCKNTRTYKKHMKNVHEQKIEPEKKMKTKTEECQPPKVPMSCVECAKSFENRNQYLQHQVIHKKRKCPYCNLEFGRHNLNSHIKTHIQDKKICDICGAVLKNTKTLRAHLEYSHGTKPKSETNQDKPATPLIEFECGQCNKKFTVRKRYTDHLHQHKRRECPICGMKITTFNYYKHVKIHSDTPKVCSICGATFKNAESLRGHIHYTHSQREYKCDYCEKVYKKKYDRLLHIRKVHTGEKNHVCDTCGKGFITLSYLTNHIKIHHSDEKPYTCQYCEKDFTNIKALTQHEKQHHGIKEPYKCDICLQSFEKKSLLREHKSWEHNLIEPQQSNCSFCVKKFSSEYALKCHLNKQHTNADGSLVVSGTGNV